MDKRQLMNLAREGLKEQSKDGGSSLFGMLLSYALGYLRWTQFIPMVAGWFAVIFLFGALAFGRFAVGLKELDAETQASFWSAPGVQETIESAKKSVDFISARYRTPGDEFDLGAFVRGAWSVLALIGFLLSLLLGALGFHFRPRSFGEKIKMLGIISICVALGAVIVLFSFGEALTSGPVAVVVWPFSVVMIPFLLSCWGLGVSHVIAKVEELLGLHAPRQANGTGGVSGRAL